MQFSKLLPTVLVAIGICTWTFIAAQEEYPESQSSTKPRTRFQSNQFPEQFDDRDQSTTLDWVDGSSGTGSSHEIIRVATNQSDRAFIPQVAELALGAQPTQPSFKVFDFPEGSRAGVTEITAGARTKRTRVQIEVKTTASPPVTEIWLRPQFTATEMPIPPPIPILDKELTRNSDGSIVFTHDFKDFLNKGPFDLRLTVKNSNAVGGESVAGGPLSNIEFLQYDLPSVKINSIFAYKTRIGNDAESTKLEINNDKPYTNRRDFTFGLTFFPSESAHTEFLARTISLELLNGGSLIATKSLSFSNNAANLTQNVNFELGSQFTGPLSLSVRYKVDDPATLNDNHFSPGYSSSHDPRLVIIDTTGPEIIDARLLSSNVLELRFRSDDLDEATAIVTTNYNYARTSTSFSGMNVHQPTGASRNQNTITLTLDPASIQTDTYKIAPTAGLKDLAGNSASIENVVVFNSFPDRERGIHVPFPDFVNRAERDKTKVFNPGDKVETRVARLYYYRDAHRVAEIINRNVKSHNRAAVKVTEQEAERSRDAAERFTSERRASERQAIFDAQQTRLFERDIQQKERELAELQAKKSRLEGERRNAEREINEALQALQALMNLPKASLLDQQPPETAPAPGNPTVPSIADSREQAVITARLEAARSLRTNLTAELDITNSQINTVNTDLTKANTDATASRRAEFNSREKVATGERNEDLARAAQFRKELAAASADPDTYVPGDINSLDPVTQTSISVIGEGLIQLRGPIRGINTIREMISQIDTPVGQVKVGIHTVQINGEHGDRMETVASRIEASLKLGQNLTSQSLMLLRRAIQEVAAEMVDLTNAQSGEGHRQVDRDRRYLYNFFGRDFTDELYEMDSEFLRSENKLLGLHSMDTLSIAQAMFVLALAKNDVRQSILQRFRHLVMCELPEAEWDHRRTTKLLPRKFNTLEEVILNANARYHFRNLYAFVNAQVGSSETMTPTQREFLRLAQIFKSQLVAEMEYRERVLERGLIEDQSNSEDELRGALKDPHDAAVRLIADAYRKAVQSTNDLADKWKDVETPIIESELQTRKFNFAVKSIKDRFDQFREELKSRDVDQRTLENIEDVVKRFRLWRMNRELGDRMDRFYNLPLAKAGDQRTSRLKDSIERSPQVEAHLQEFNSDDLLRLRHFVHEQIGLVVANSQILSENLKKTIARRASDFDDRWKEITMPSSMDIILMWHDLLWSTEEGISLIDFEMNHWLMVNRNFVKFREMAENPATELAELRKVYTPLLAALGEVIGWMDSKEDKTYSTSLWKLSNTLREVYDAVRTREVQILAAKSIEKRTRGSLDHRKLMDFHIDEQAEKVVELAEGTRSHIAQIDNYLKRMFIALEDDFQAQFYDPAFEDIRRASRSWDVNLGQVERTTILGNNRTLMKVSPQATMEFDLPKRHTAIFEGMAVAKAAYQEYGALVTDPNFLGLSKLASGSPAVGGDPRYIGQGGAYRDTLQSPSVKNVLPGLGSSSDEQMFSQVAGNKTQFGAALEGLIPDPAVYKFETGTGFEIRPVIQPDGTSLVFDFDYMYTTNVREPIRADEKHLGRVKRHFIHTQVQTTSFELREISRYLVALKASRTSRGVPLLEDVPIVGGLFRPLPSAESALQQNIILSQSMAYPTLFDLMGLRWSRHLVDLDHIGLRDSEHVVRGRYQSVKNFTFDESARNFDDVLDIEKKQPQHFRTDLYHRNSFPSPYHPGGYHHRKMRDDQDPTGRQFTIPDNRPPEMQDPYYDPKFRRPIDAEPVGPGQLLMPQSVGPGERIEANEPPQFLPPKRGEQVGPGQLLTPEFIEPGERLNDTLAPDTSRRTGPSPRGGGPSRNQNQTSPQLEYENFESSRTPRGIEGTLGQRRTSRSSQTHAVDKSSTDSLIWVVHEQPAVNKNGKNLGSQQIEPRYLPSPATTKGLPSLKQLFSGGKPTATTNSWLGTKPQPATETPPRPKWSRLRIEMERWR